MFHELTRPFKVAKEQIFKRINVFSLSKKMIKEQKAAIDKEKASNAPPVAKGVSKEEYRSRYSKLNAFSCVVLGFMFYVVTFIIFSVSFLSFVVGSLILIFLLVHYFSSIQRAWAARYYYRNWDKRFERADLRTAYFIDSLLTNRRLLLPVFDIKYKE